MSFLTAVSTLHFRPVCRDAEGYDFHDGVLCAYCDGGRVRTPEGRPRRAEVWGSVYDIRELLDSTVKLMDGKSPLDIELPGTL